MPSLLAHQSKPSGEETLTSSLFSIELLSQRVIEQEKVSIALERLQITTVYLFTKTWQSYSESIPEELLQDEELIKMMKSLTVEFSKETNLPLHYELAMGYSVTEALSMLSKRIKVSQDVSDYFYKKYSLNLNHWPIPVESPGCEYYLSHDSERHLIKQLTFSKHPHGKPEF